ncbi:hypothetical protein J2R99_000025 [Rhodopseudomonas julia]|uniref:DUF411 domain-containing protein n=1 Tax=Rhodopseudomonas julia TaxID=200617 RepID=A0ABU0C0X7_9BRAD|nr:DUF411 domain-containing protein [Rhodopseudomonas julia]MDQ0324176.1 hypothetical protein [Rhodopseudomonas julia]
MKSRFLLAGAAVAGMLAVSSVHAEGLPAMTVYKDPSCGCCTAWADKMRTEGFAVEVVPTDDIGSVKQQFGVPDELASCHTAVVGGYVLEGHVPSAMVAWLLDEKPMTAGLAVPGMPVGSEGMAMPGMEPDTYPVVSFGASGQSTYARYRGEERLSD